MVATTLPLTMSDYIADCPSDTSGCFTALSVLNVQALVNNTVDDVLLDQSHKSSIVMSSQGVTSLVFSVAMQNVSQLVRWRRIYTRSTGIDTLNVTLESQGRTCECVGSSRTGQGYSLADDRFFCRARSLPCPEQDPKADSVCIASAPGLAACRYQTVVISRR